MNKGLGVTTGDVVGFLNAGDVFGDRETLRRVMECFRDRNADACYGDVVFFNKAGKTVRTWRAGAFKTWKVYLGWAAPHPSFFTKRDFYVRLGGFNPDFRSAGDYEFMLRCFLKHGVRPYRIPSVLARMQIGGFSNASLRNILLNMSEIRSAWRRNNLAFGYLAPLARPLSKMLQYVVRDEPPVSNA